MLRPTAPSLVLSWLSLAIASVAGAATLTLETDKPTYLVGETITMTATGFSEGAAAERLTVTVLYDAALTEATGVSSQVPHTSMNGMQVWSGGGAQGALDDGRALLLDQLAPGPAGPKTTDPSATIGTVQLLAEAAGTVTVTFFVEQGNSLTLHYFGITNQPGISFRILVPEPATGALLGLALVALSLGRRRR